MRLICLLCASALLVPGTGRAADSWSTDVDGDGKADACGRGAAGVKCHLASGTGFVTAVDGPGWSDANGWKAAAHHATIRLGGVACVPAAEVCDGKDNDCDGEVDEDAGCSGADLGPDEPQDGGGPSEAGPPDEGLEFPEDGGGWSWQDGWSPPGDGGSGAPSDGGGCDCQMPRGRLRSAGWLLLFGAGLTLLVVRWLRARRARRPLKRAGPDRG